MTTGNKNAITTKMNNEIKKNQNKIIKNNSNDFRKEPASGYPEKKPVNKQNIQDNPENQNSG